MDPQFQELANEIADAVEKRLSGTLEERIKTHIDKSEERVATRVEKRLSGAFEERIKEHIDKFEQRSEQRMKMHFENLEDKVTLAAEGYGATLDGINRKLADLNEKVDNGFRDHALVLTDHGERIAKLEKR
jgi:Skp family chaperone for outer membrane proteins